MGINYFPYFENKSDGFRFALFDLNKKQKKESIFSPCRFAPKK